MFLQDRRTHHSDDVGVRYKLRTKVHCDKVQSQYKHTPNSTILLLHLYYEKTFVLKQKNQALLFNSLVNQRNMIYFWNHNLFCRINLCQKRSFKHIQDTNHFLT